MEVTVKTEDFLPYLPGMSYILRHHTPIDLTSWTLCVIMPVRSLPIVPQTWCFFPLTLPSPIDLSPNLSNILYGILIPF